jgi:hypothetical protein
MEGKPRDENKHKKGGRRSKETRQKALPYHKDKRNEEQTRGSPREKQETVNVSFSQRKL